MCVPSSVLARRSSLAKSVCVWCARVPRLSICCRCSLPLVSCPVLPSILHRIISKAKKGLGLVVVQVVKIEHRCLLSRRVRAAATPRGAALTKIEQRGTTTTQQQRPAAAPQNSTAGQAREAHAAASATSCGQPPPICASVPRISVCAGR